MKRFKDINLMALDSLVALQTATATLAGRLVATTESVRKLSLAVGVLLTPLFVTAPALAAGNGCTSSAARQLFGFLNAAAQFVIGIAGVGSLLMFAIGAAFIIMGGTPEKVSKGMKIVKNAIIGLGILVAAVFIKTVVLAFVEGATGVKGSSCIKRGDGRL
jgi:hypothetical protein